jgi:hypothetical protein
VLLRRGARAHGHRRREHDRSQLQGLHTSPPFGPGDAPASGRVFVNGHAIFCVT